MPPNTGEAAVAGPRQAGAVPGRVSLVPLRDLLTILSGDILSIAG